MTGQELEVLISIPLRRMHLDQAASSSNVIPDPKAIPGHPAVGRSVERRGSSSPTMTCRYTV
jgi:hypothetical protein